MIIISAILDTYRSLKDRTFKVTFETNELNPQEILGLAEMNGSYGYLAFKKEPFNEKERQEIESLETNLEDTMKTPSQRMRSILYLLYNRDSEGYKSFASYYEGKMEVFNNSLKKRLNEGM